MNTTNQTNFVSHSQGEVSGKFLSLASPDYYTTRKSGFESVGEILKTIDLNKLLKRWAKYDLTK